MKYIFTREDFNAFQQVIEETQTKVDEIMKMKTKAMTAGDSWHSEPFKIALVEEITWLTRLEQLKEAKKHAKVVDPPDQNEVVTIGTGVLIQRKGRPEPEKCFLGGLRFDIPPEGHVSIQSPLGKALIRAKIGEKRTFHVGDKEITVTVLKIFPPSQVKEFMSENKE